MSSGSPSVAPAASRLAVPRLVRTVRLYFVLLGAALRAQAQYRANLFLLALGGIAYQGVGFCFLLIVVERFGSIGGWGFAEVAFLYALRLGAHGVWLCLFNQLIHIDQIVREAEYDRYLVRPLNPLVQLLTRGVSLSVLGDLIGGLGLLVAASILVDVDWSVVAIGYLVLAVVGGGLVEASVQLVFAALAFRLLSTDGIRYIGDDVFNIFAPYPLKIFPRVVQLCMTFVVPLAFVAYMPAATLLGRTGELAVPAEFAYAAPVLGGVLIIAAYRFWRYQTRFYTSSGS